MNQNPPDFLADFDGNKHYNSMLLADDGLFFYSKSGFATAADFREAFEKKSLMAAKTSITWEKVKAARWENGSDSVNFDYAGMNLTTPSEFDFSKKPENIQSLIQYLEQVQKFRRTDLPLSPFKAALPYLIGLVVTVFGTGLILKLITEGGEIRTNVIFVLLIKLGEKLGPIGTLLAGGLISIFIGYKMWKAYQNPPIETRLER